MTKRFSAVPSHPVVNGGEDLSLTGALGYEYIHLTRVNAKSKVKHIHSSLGFFRRHTWQKPVPEYINSLQVKLGISCSKEILPASSYNADGFCLLGFSQVVQHEHQGSCGKLLRYVLSTNKTHTTLSFVNRVTAKIVNSAIKLSLGICAYCSVWFLTGPPQDNSS